MKLTKTVGPVLVAIFFMVPGIAADAASGTLYGGGCEAGVYNQRITSGSTASTALGTCSAVGVDAVPYSDFITASSDVSDYDSAQGPYSAHGLGYTSQAYFVVNY